METRRQELDPIFKDLLTNILALPFVAVFTEVEVSRLPRTIDALVVAETDSAQEQLRAQTILHHARRYNVIEFKGQNDRLDLKGYARIVGRAHLYVGGHDDIKSFDEMSLTIICAGKPTTVLRDHVQHFKETREGVYQKEDSPQITIIVINELPITPENYPLLVFASSKRKFKQFFVQMVEELGSDPRTNPILYLAYHIRGNEIEELNMMKPMRIRSVPRSNLQFIANDIGDLLVEFIPDDVLLKGITSDQMLDRISPDQMLDRISPDQMLDRISPDQMLDRISPDQMLDRISPDQMISRLSVEELASMMEKKRWEMVQTADSADDRITVINEIPNSERAVFLSVENRAQLLAELDEQEQQILLAWINREKHGE